MVNTSPIARKRFGQHFLRHKPIIRRIIENIDDSSCDLVVEIGPGHGALTDFLVERYKKIELIEIGRDLVAILSQRYADRPSITIRQCDVLDFDFSALAKEAGHRLLIVGNLPYNISSRLLIHLLLNVKSIREMTFMLQREIAERLTAEPGSRSYGRLTVNIARFFSVETLFEVSPDAFHPVPKVWSSVVRFRRRAKPIGPSVDPEFFARLVRDAFLHRRKTLRNSLKDYKAEEVLVKLGIDPQLRAENLSIEQFAQMASYLKP